MKPSHALRIFLLSAVVLIPIPANAVNYCYIDGNTSIQYVSPLTLTTSDNFLSKQIACGHTISGSGCTVELAADLNLASGTCLYIGRGVTFDGNGNGLHCTHSSYCLDPAVVTTATTPTGSGASTVLDLELSGCWFDGMSHQNSNNAVAEDVTINFPASCDITYVLGQPFSGGQNGISNFNTVTRTTIVNAKSYAIGSWLTNGMTVTDSVIRNSDVGVLADGVTGTKIVNGLLDTNTQSVYAGTGSYDVQSEGAVFQSASSGHCGAGASLTCLEFTGSRASFVDFAIK